MKRISLICLLLSACVSAPKRVARVDERKITVLTYNVENLFDTEDDPEKQDETFLPLSVKESEIYQNRCRTQASNPYYVRECLTKDWSPRVLDRKLIRLTDVVAQVGDGTGPDILIVEETESLEVLNKWRDQYMKQMGYQSLAYVKGPDERGINPAIFSRLPMIGEAKLHEINFATVENNPRPSRGILEAHFRLPNGEPLAVFAVHFPSQGAPTPFRKVAMQTLLDEALRLPADTNVIVGGDFNISAKEDFKEHFFRQVAHRDFAVSHMVGCRECVGTIYYPRDATWSFFDVLLFNKKLSAGGSGWQLDPESIRIVNSSIYQVRFDGKPSRFSRGGGATGVSDHWPMYAELNWLEPQVVGDKK